MRLFASKVGPIAQECVRALIAAKDIEAESPKDVEADVVAVLQNYLAKEREVNDKARDLLSATGRSNEDFNRVRGQIAESNGIKVGDETLDYVLDRVVACFYDSDNVDEVFSEDVALRRRMVPVFKKYMEGDSELDAEVRGQIKNAKEGTPLWDIEYARVMEQTRRKRGLT